MDLAQAREYDALRPRYPDEVVAHILATGAAGAAGEAAQRIVELGAGTGILTRALMRSGQGQGQGQREGVSIEALEAVEPSAIMAEVLRQRSGDAVDQGLLRVHRSTAEDTGLEAGGADVVVASQAWHWFDAPVVQREIHRILAPGGVLMIVSNHLDTEDAWIHRLTRIMRAGDIYRPGGAPALHPGLFLPVETMETRWTRELTSAGVRRLATTLSSWLSAGEKERQRRRANLDWYLGEHTGLAPEDQVVLPYVTVLHAARRR